MIVGPKEALARDIVYLKEINWLGGPRFIWIRRNTGFPQGKRESVTSATASWPVAGLQERPYPRKNNWHNGQKCVAESVLTL